MLDFFFNNSPEKVAENNRRKAVEDEIKSHQRQVRWVKEQVLKNVKDHWVGVPFSFYLDFTFYTEAAIVEALTQCNKSTWEFSYEKTKSGQWLISVKALK